MDMLDGMFSFVLLDTRDNSFLVARDAIGITSLYIGWGLDGIYTFFSSAGNETKYLFLKNLGFDQILCLISCVALRICLGVV